MNKELSNDQRARLEQIARDEFNIRQREVSITKRKVFDDWKAKECKRVEQSALVKRYAKLSQEMTTIRKRLNNAGFSIDCSDGRGNVKVSMFTSTYGGSVTIKGFQTRYQASIINNDSFTRGLNKVLAIIWSMERPFSECIKLIQAEVKKIK
jgi:hypothetical protein